LSSREPSRTDAFAGHTVARSATDQDDTGNQTHLERRRARLGGRLYSWAEQNKQIVAIAILDWGGNLIESHAMEGAPANAIDTALLKASPLCAGASTSEPTGWFGTARIWRRPLCGISRSRRASHHDQRQVIGAIGVSGADGEKCGQAAIDAVFRGQATSSRSNRANTLKLMLRPCAG